MAETPDTDHFGLTRVGEGEQLSKNGFAAFDIDRVTIDDLLYALSEHSHDGSDRLPDPAGSPALIPVTTGGSLPPDTTLYYRVSFLDKWGLETAGSSESAVTTATAIAPPVQIAATIESASGTLGPGNYSYVATFYTASGGETTPSVRTDVRIVEGTLNRIRLDVPALVAGVAGVRIYRARPGQTQFYYLTETDEDFIYDDGLIEDATVSLPPFNTTNSTNSITVTIPGGAVPDDVYGWKIYRSVEPSTYSGFNLVHVVVESTTATSHDLRSTWIDNGDALQRGEPRQVSATVSGGRNVDLEQSSGQLPLSAMARGSRSWDPYVPGNVVFDQTYARFEARGPISPTSISAYFLSAPSTTTTGSQVGFRVVDSAGSFVEMATDGTNGKYYVRNLPITAGEKLEAEDGDRPPGTVPVVTDQTASNGQALEFDAVGDISEYDLGILDKGRYYAYASVRLDGTGNVGPVGDLNLSAIQTGATTQVLGERDYTVVRQGTGATPVGILNAYYELVPISFFAPGGVSVKLRLTKTTSEVATYLFDYFRYAAELTQLVAGPISLVASVADLPDQSYVQTIPATGQYWRFDKDYLILKPGATVGTAVLSASDNVADTYTITSSQSWLTVTPSSANTASTTLTFTLDASSLSAGERSVAIVTVGGATHQDGHITVVGLKGPATPGADVNISVAY